MRRTTLLAFCLTAMLPVMAQRQVINFNFGWKFHLGDINPSALSTLGNQVAMWRTVDVPHDFQVEQPWVAPQANEQSSQVDNASNFKSRLSARGFKEMGCGWYVKSYTPDNSLKGKRILIDFEGIMYVGDVYLNGERIGGTDYGYVGFEIDLSRKLKYGQENIIAVKASTGGNLNSRWYTGGGLFRDVHLVITHPDEYFARHPLYITTEGNKDVHIKAEVVNHTKDNLVRVNAKILGNDGRVVYDHTQELPYNRKWKSLELPLATIHLDNPHVWSPDDPYLYTAQVSLLDSQGNTLDQSSSHFGIRTIEISPDFGLRVNGKKVLLKGIANHHTLGALGAAAYPRAMEKRLRLLKSFGFNHVRTSHNPYSTSFLDLCDSLGILVVDELYDKWLDQYTGGRASWQSLWQQDLPEWIKRDRNHPSVVFWSLGNELQTYNNLPFNDWGVTVYRMMKPVLHRYDNTRLVTVAMHPRGRSLETDSLPAPLVYETDIKAYNYRYLYFKTDGRKHPDWIFYQSEANTSNMGPNFFGMDRDKVIGLAYWGQIDYLGESGGWPAKGWAQGSFDMSLQPKPIAWMLKSMFSDEPTVHIGVIDDKNSSLEWNGVNVGTDRLSENWNRKVGSTVSLYTYTNAEKVELLLNGKSLGVKENTADWNTRNKIRWDHVPYHPGILEAVAYRQGKVVARHRIETTGDAVRLVAIPDAETWKADGQDLEHIRIYAVDRQGRRVYAAHQELTFQVTGDAKIVGVDNGDINSNEMLIGDHRQLYQGSALVILRAGLQPGKITLSVTSPGLKGTRVKIDIHRLAY